MSKIKLTLESLRVESFDTAAAGEDRGTVAAYAATAATKCQTWCGPECDTYYGPCPSAADECPSSPHAYTPCAGCVETDPFFCIIEG